jgi:hypothetical protein
MRLTGQWKYKWVAKSMQLRNGQPTGGLIEADLYIAERVIGLPSRTSFSVAHTKRRR